MRGSTPGLGQFIRADQERLLAPHPSQTLRFDGQLFSTYHWTTAVGSVRPATARGDRCWHVRTWSQCTQIQHVSRRAWPRVGIGPGGSGVVRFRFGMISRIDRPSWQFQFSLFNVNTPLSAQQAYARAAAAMDAKDKLCVINAFGGVVSTGDRPPIDEINAIRLAP
jgi:hypothetical protein